MFRALLSYFWKDNSSELSVDDAYKLLEKSCENDEEKEENKSEETVQEYSTYHKTGVVTNVQNNTVVIDNTYRFESDISLKVGMKVSFVAYFAEGKTNVSHIKVLDDDWNLEVDEENRSWCTRALITKVVKRENRKIHISPGDFIIHLNKVHSEFVPIVGDWLDLQVKVEVEQKVADFFGKILEVEAIRPLRPRVLQGVVKKWDENKGMGVIDNKIFFNSGSLVGGYSPLVNDKVITEAIESEQGMYNWRSLKVIPQTNMKPVIEIFHKLDDYKSDVQGVNISEDIYMNVSDNNKTYNFAFEITNNTNDLLILLNAYFSNKISPFKVSMTFNVKGLEIGVGQSLKIECECFVRTTSSNLILFEFEKYKIGRYVTINYETDTQSYDKAKHVHGTNLLLQARMFTNRRTTDVIPGQKVVQAPRFISARLPEYPVPEKLLNMILKHNSFNDSPELSQELTVTKSCLTVPLSLYTYEDKFHTLLHLEEIHNLIAIRTYDQEVACFIRNGEYLMLEIENLCERRPSIMVGDRVLVKDSYKIDAVSYEGYVHRVGAKHIYIKFAQMFHDAYGGEDYSVKIVSSRTTFRRLHQAVGLVVRNLGPAILFPSKVVEKAPQLNFTYDKYHNILPTTHKKLKNRCLFEAANCNFSEEQLSIDNKEGESTTLNKVSKLVLTENNINYENKKWKNDCFNSKIAPTYSNNQRFKLEWYDKSLNYYQKEAVRNVLMGTARPLPYVIFGPPGTGKTVTLIEIILQILRMIPHSRLLVAAPSNSAADLLASRLIDSGVLKPGDLVRLVAYRCILENSVPPKLVPYSATIDSSKEGSRDCPTNMTDDGIILGCNSSVIGRHRVTVGTCSALGGLFSLGFSKGHFTHIIVDEAGQASEPDIMIPLAFLDVATGQAILAGDHMQLGPVILSNIALSHGLGESYLERLINRFPYSRDIAGFPDSNGYDPQLVTKLIYNYRSLPDLLKLSNCLFYNNELKPTISCEDSEEAQVLNKIKEILPDRQSGPPCFIFHGVLGENYQTLDSPSWFNPNEASQIFYYVNELYRLGIPADNIGIITPYIKQVRQIRSLLDDAEFELPKIGTVEEFQGREFHIIILSLVRSNQDLVSNDLRYGIGFLSNPKRMNVALTRAQTLTIVIGNPYTVAADCCWRKVIKFCIENDAYIGCELNNPELFE